MPINLKSVKIAFTESNSPGGVFNIDFVEGIANFSLGYSPKKEKYELKPERIREFEVEAGKIGINHWGKEYYRTVLDGYTFNIEFQFMDNSKKTVYCSNALPPNWDEFWIAVKQLTATRFSVPMLDYIED